MTGATLVPVRFLRFVSYDDVLRVPGDRAELPAEIAVTLSKAGVVSIELPLAARASMTDLSEEVPNGSR